jgi:hypothetical protein
MDSTGSSAVGIVVALLAIAGLWKVFTKAGRPGWGAIIPIYDIYLLVKVAGRSGWWVVLYLIPVVNIVIHAIVAMDVARNFGKSRTFGIIGLWLFSVVGFLILGFGGATYQGERAQRAASAY